MRWGLMRENRRRTVLSAAALIGFAGCAGPTSVQQQTSQTYSESPVQQAVTAAWEADRAGNSEAALAGYLEVLAQDPGNKWAKSRVERLSAALPKGETMIAKTPAAQPTAPTKDPFSIQHLLNRSTVSSSIICRKTSV